MKQFVIQSRRQKRTGTRMHDKSVTAVADALIAHDSNQALLLLSPTIDFSHLVSFIVANGRTLSFAEQWT